MKKHSGIMCPDTSHLKRTFGEAIEALKDGKEVRRIGWRAGMFLLLEPETIIKSEWRKDEFLGTFVDENGGEILCGTIYMYTRDNVGGGVWLASQSDMLSEDWVILK
jgi:hypothetical protein